MYSSFGKGVITPAIAGEQHVVFTKRLYVPGKRPILWCHSAGGDAAEPLMTANAQPLLESLVKLGSPVISFDGKTSGLTLSGTYAATHWSNDGALARFADALAYLRSSAWNASASLAPLVVGVSMGGLLALNYARSNPVAALALLFPVTSLAGIHDGTGGIIGNAAASVETAYGGASAYSAALPTHDPLANPALWNNVPAHMWYSDSDTTVGTLNQQNFLSGVGTFESTVMAGAGHADLSRVNTNEFFDFVRQHV